MKSNISSNVIVFLVVLGLGMLGIFGTMYSGKIRDMISNQGVDPVEEPRPQKPKNLSSKPANEIWEKAEELEQARWDQVEYGNISDRLDLAFKEGIIKKVDEKDLVRERLEKAYIKTLNDSLNSFLRRSESLGSLYELKKELDRYYNQSNTYSTLVRSPRRKAQNLYRLNNFKKDALSYISSSSYSQARSARFIDSIETLADLSYLRISPIAQAIEEVAVEKLKDHMATEEVKALRADLEAYYKGKYISEKRSDFLSRINGLQNNQYIKNDSRVQSFCRNEKATLIQHRDASHLMRIANRGNFNCDTIPSRFIYYRNTCDSIRNDLARNGSQD